VYATMRNGRVPTTSTGSASTLSTGCLSSPSAAEHRGVEGRGPIKYLEKVYLEKALRISPGSRNGRTGVFDFFIQSLPARSRILVTIMYHHLNALRDT